MLHQPGRFMNVLEVGGEAAETVFHFLQDNNLCNLFFQPDAKEIGNYIYLHTWNGPGQEKEVMQGCFLKCLTRRQKAERSSSHCWRELGYSQAL